MHPWIYITNKFEDYMASHPKVADFFAWYEGDTDPNSYPEEEPGFWDDTKNAPAAATAKASEAKQNIVYLSLSRQQPKRKAVR